INLSITRPHGMCGMTDRIFNVLHSRGFLLTDRTPSLLECFREGWDLETFSSPEEMNDKIRFYLAHETQRAAIARQGAETVLRGHLFVHRIREMVARLRPLLA
ncbi:MAG: glycosyltransferase family 1 protein, partial [Magnetococcales bacterium]|nr:glycosyltransferase family 1 protein [Magnetococcales bacterium]